MRLLIGATCVAVMAFVGYFFWNEYADAQARAKNAQEELVRDFDTNCRRISLWFPQYDDAYAQSFSKNERQDRVKECITYFETGKRPN
ncbi:hypothetical protein A8A54_15505 [Brucella pseudogrignonensis]|uniref:hypothetical protein n=1 Tax=Brucella pseudogrignonensis TaxID=419475 RepID=UPI0007DA8BD9|nr:hypothetical protein [Brucella pseudogrignonensis]ANG97763.1 hypothetical protein A8A54_15505 [Brucella pseudogrignonensis]